MKKTMILGAMAGLAMLGSAGAQADYYSGGCEQNFRGEMICPGESVRDVNTNSYGTVLSIGGYYSVQVRFYSGEYAGMVETMGVNSLSPTGYNPYPPQPVPPTPYPPSPYPPQPVPPYPNPYPQPAAQYCYGHCQMRSMCMDGCPPGGVCNYVPAGAGSPAYWRVLSCGGGPVF